MRLGRSIGRVESVLPSLRFLRPVELAPVYVLLASDEASYITGEVYGANGGRTRCDASLLAVVRRDHRIELVVIHGLDQVPIEAGLQRAAMVLRLSIPTQGHQHHPCTFLRLPQSLRDFKSVQSGQSNIEEYDLGFETPRRLEGGRTVEGNANLMVIKPEEHCATLGGICAVIHD